MESSLYIRLSTELDATENLALIVFIYLPNNTVTYNEPVLYTVSGLLVGELNCKASRQLLLL